MSIYKGNLLIAGGSQALPLLCFMWSDHQLNHPSWLNSTTFSWQSGAVYQAAYAHLTADITGKTLQSETIAGTTIQFYLADDGHKICPASEESNVTAIYNATGVAWYYIIDTTNQRFKLPRTKFGFTGIRNGVGKYVSAGLPNITGYFQASSMSSANADGAFRLDSSWGSQGWDGWAGGGRTYSIDASRSSSVYGNSTTVQPPATEMYLYFYVGNFTQTALENTAGLNAELFNGKADVSTVAHVVTEFQEPTSSNNYTWYRKYADGWVEQGGWRNNTGGTITFPIAMSLTNQYTAILVHNGNTAKGEGFVHCYNKTSTGMSYDLSVSTSGMAYVSWQVSGMAA